ncbi:MAG: ABC transporter ATP-binding protein [Candidatus Omnitrophica bacterium]|nr:ABC transporter ATP-binding protein [Candidatus Omnitrophota bacterium]
MDTILDIQDLTVKIGHRRVLDGVSIPLRKGRMTALVGESGSGKTLTALAALKLLPDSAVLENGKILFEGKDILKLEGEELRRLRGHRVSMVFQEPFTSLNPLLTVGAQISETLIAHNRVHDERSASDIVSGLLGTVRMPPDIAARFPHEISGGMRQRAVLAMAMSCSPDVLLLDEPTTALDVCIQKHVLDLIVDIQKEKGFAGLFITHDLSIVNMLADDVCVMREGRVVERGDKEEVLRTPKHPYTRHLLDCIPRLGDVRRRLPAGS